MGITIITLNLRSSNIRLYGVIWRLFGGYMRIVEKITWWLYGDYDYMEVI